MAVAATRVATAMTVFKRVILYMARPPSMPIGRMGECPGSKCRPELISQLGYRLANYLTDTARLSLFFAVQKVWQFGHAGRRRKRSRRRHDTGAEPGYSRAACQPTTASATASVEAK